MRLHACRSERCRMWPQCRGSEGLRSTRGQPQRRVSYTRPSAEDNGALGIESQTILEQYFEESGQSYGRVITESLNYIGLSTGCPF